MIKRHFISLVFGVLLVLGASSQAWAITLTEAAQKAARQHNAKVVSARTVKRNGKRIHVIKLLKEDGVVKTVQIPEN